MIDTAGFADWLRSLGLRPGAVLPDGRWRRCPTESHPRKKNGSYKLAIDGRVGWGRDFATHTEPLTWRAEKGGILQNDEVQRRNERIHAQMRRERMAKREIARAEAAAFFESCAPLEGGHPYLDDHGLDMTGCHGLRIDDDGWLVVPARLPGGQIGSVQRISPGGDKLFWKGAPISGTCHAISRRRSQVWIMCEGLATGLALYRCVPHASVVVAWSAGNLEKTRWRLSGMVVVAADNDHGTEERRGFNPGVRAAEAAAEAIGAGVVWPEGIEGTDWSDYRQERISHHRERLGRWDPPSKAVRLAEAEIRRRVLNSARMVR